MRAQAKNLSNYSLFGFYLKPKIEIGLATSLLPLLVYFFGVLLVFPLIWRGLFYVGIPPS